MEIRVKQLGLAAYIQMMGCNLLRFDNGDFVFESDKTTPEWRVEYINSCCSRHDAAVCSLRHHLK